MHILAKWLLTTLAFLAAAYLIPGITVGSLLTALLLAVIWGLISITIKPILLVITLPINILTLGLFTFVLNGLLLLILGQVIKGFTVDGFIPAIFGAFVISAVTWFGELVLKATPAQ